MRIYSMGITVFFLFIFIFSTTSFAQGKYGEVGKLFTETEAQELFGPVLEEVEITPEYLRAHINRNGDYTLFNIIDGELVISNESRTIVTVSDKIDDRTVMYVFSNTMIEEMLSKGKGESVKIRKHSKVISMAFGPIILELSYPCPPMC